MNIKLDENRKMNISTENKTQNENDITILNITVPEEYSSYTMKISFYTPNENIGSEIVVDNTYILTNAITQYEKVFFYITLIKDNKIFISETKPLKFIKNKKVNGEIPQEEIDIVDSILDAAGDKIEEVQELETEIQTKLDNGEFDGKDGIDGQDGVGISNIVFNNDYTMTITLTNGNIYTSPVLRGVQGEQGVQGIPRS